jgi:hypothetical protein
MIDWATGITVSVFVLVTYIGIKVINRMFEKTDNKKKNSLF